MVNQNMYEGLNTRKRKYQKIHDKQNFEDFRQTIFHHYFKIIQ